MPPRPYRLPLAAILLSAALSACSTPKEDAYVERPADQLMSEADAAMGEESFKKAAQLYDEVERQHPYSDAASKAQLMAAYAHYQALKYDDAILALDRFIQLHPGSPDVDYAYYMRALCYYEQITDVRRDQRITRQALDSLSEVVRRFPESKYARDAKLKIDLTNDHLAGKEMEVGRFYLRQHQYTAAINRFRTVVENFQTTSHVPEALHRLVECYLALGVTDEAKAAAAVLGHNFPGSEWYTDSYALLVDANLRPERNERSWLNQVWNSVF
ncbi:outer membrane protein assembly factor BamD [Azospirillum picis]|uniref:Outer membrane protein assembly factor BamD n=1 Tax=Azospirillum picis TaxID=488438 RepID=A0ABU0MJ12_9PROT|nr:outer membrane protein assembly factor BamD [Azospirillum picis]MBP2299417.1 outer membrane protein assembly factor BamD [Azospirillum picis]MDQ0533456.1 outer membrane protein assembly factor BamD [Azospirillum picis]